MKWTHTRGAWQPTSIDDVGLLILYISVTFNIDQPTFDINSYNKEDYVQKHIWFSGNFIMEISERVHVIVKITYCF